MVTFLLLVAMAAVVFLVRHNYQLEKRWRCMRYCWHSMSDFAGERLREGGEYDQQWRYVVKEQAALMARFGVRPLSSADLRDYEMELIARDLPPLEEHRLGL